MNSYEPVKLAGILEKLAGKLQLQPSGEVDWQATNQSLVLSRRPLNDFVLVPPQDPCVPQLPPRDKPSETAIAPAEIAIVILCGGLSMRSGGRMHPLLQVNDGRSLIEIQLDRLAASELRGSLCLVHCSPLNRGELAKHLHAHGILTYAGGLAPRLALYQLLGAPLVLAQPGSWNPGGHWDSLRWLVMTGAFSAVRHKRLLMIVSYTNFGEIFQGGEGVARQVWEQLREQPGALSVVEVTARSSQKKTGSFVVRDTSGFHLVKKDYGPGDLRSPDTSEVLSSTNTWWFDLARLEKRLISMLGGDAQLWDALLADACVGRRMADTATLFDKALPVLPKITPKIVGDRTVLQAERDLDQLSLLEPGIVQLLRVPVARAVSLKSREDVERTLGEIVGANRDVKRPFKNKG